MQGIDQRLEAECSVQPEDLAPLVYIQLRLFGFEHPTFDHVVIDEAQDYSPFSWSR